jgi:hypothetical protein
MIRPAVVLHGDWGTAPSKRWVAKALERDGAYRVDTPSLAGDLQSLLPRAVESARGQVVAGFDFPIGVPASWAQQAGVTSFLEALPEFGLQIWSAFYDPALCASEITVRRPFYPKRPGGTLRSHLWQGLGLQSWHELYRRCELPREGRSAASPLFWILGGQQVGRAAIIGWRDMLAPGLRTFGPRLGLWPFSGSVESLSNCECIVVETYPADACLQIGVCAPGRGWSKRNQNDRSRQADQIFRAALETGTVLSGELQRALVDDFGPHPDGEDQFDAVVGLIAMLRELASSEPGRTPPHVAVEACEGWIFGQPPSAA